MQEEKTRKTNLEKVVNKFMNYLSASIALVIIGMKFLVS